MAKRLFGLLVMLIILASASLSYAENDVIGLSLDGQSILSDTTAMIVSGRTLVPARAVFEAMGGVVAWDDARREVTVTRGSSEVKLIIDSKTAIIDGLPKDMDVPAAIISERTMIPVRFVSEALGYQVDWDDTNRIVNIKTPETDPLQLSITGIGFFESEQEYKVTITGNKRIDAYKNFSMSSPERVVLDIANGILGQISTPIIPINDNIMGIRFSQFDEKTTRIVVDLKKQIPASVSLAEDDKSLIIVFSKSRAPVDDQTGGGLPELVELAKDKLVVIDAGHGGKDPGAIGFSNGQSVLYEKDVNLDVAQRMNELLKQQGANTYMIRSFDTSVSLLERPAMANALNAHLFISIHNNSSDSSNLKGFEVLYFNKESDISSNIKSRTFADFAQTALVEKLGIAFKSPQERPTLAVLNKTSMPAIIIEGAFLSNPEDLALIMTDDYKQNYAMAAAKAIINALNASVRL